MAKLAGSIKPWASATNHVVGDYPGEPTKVDGGLGVIAAGFIPGDIFAPTAEETNFEFNRWTSVMQWVQDGDNTGAANAHVVETDAAGDLRARRGIFATLFPFAPAVQGTATGGGAGGYFEATAADGVVGRALAGGFGDYGGEFTGFTAAGGVRGVGAGAGRGGYFTGGATAPAALQADATGGSPGFIANGAGGEPDILLTPSNNYGFDIQCGAGSLGGGRILANGQPGLYITQDDPGGNALVVVGDSAANAGVPTFLAQAFGAGDAARLQASSGTGYALRVTGKSAAPTRAPISVDTQNSLPSNIESGQIGFVSGRGFVHSQFNDFGQPGPGVGWRGFWSTTGGFSLACTTQKSLLVSGGAWQEAATAVAEAGNAPTIAGRKICFRLTLSHKVNLANTPMTLNFKVRDETAGQDVLIRSGAGGGATAGIYVPGYDTVAWLPGISETFELTIPAAGDRTWKVYLSVTGATSVSTRGISLEHIGMQ